jgi:hypothetical protein
MEPRLLLVTGPVDGRAEKDLGAPYRPSLPCAALLKLYLPAALPPAEGPDPLLPRLIGAR